MNKYSTKMDRLLFNVRLGNNGVGKRRRSGVSMNASVIAIATGLFVVWLLGHGVLTLIGGIPAGTNVALADAQPGLSDTSADDSETSSGDSETSSGDSETSSGDSGSSPSLSLQAGQNDEPDPAVTSQTIDFGAEPDKPSDQLTDLATPSNPLTRETSSFAAKSANEFSPSNAPDNGGLVATDNNDGFTERENATPPENEFVFNPGAKAEEVSEHEATKPMNGIGDNVVAEQADPGAIPLLTEESEEGIEVGVEDSNEVALETPSEDQTDPVVILPPVTEKKAFPMRTWVSARGTKKTFALVKIEGSNIVVVDANGKEFTAPFSVYSESDQNYAREAYSASLNDK